MHVRNIIGLSNIYTVHPRASGAVINKLRLAPAQKAYSQDLLWVSVLYVPSLPSRRTASAVSEKPSKTRLRADIVCAVINIRPRMITRYREMYIIKGDQARKGASELATFRTMLLDTGMIYSRCNLEDEFKQHREYSRSRVNEKRYQIRERFTKFHRLSSPNLLRNDESKRAKRGYLSAIH